MTCTHEKKWMTATAAYPDALGQAQLLDEGWEPFAVTPETEQAYARYHFRKPRPCKKCALSENPIISADISSGAGGDLNCAIRGKRNPDGTITITMAEYS